MFYFFFFIQKTENNIFLEKRWPTFYDIIFFVFARNRVSRARRPTNQLGLA